MALYVVTPLNAFTRISCLTTLYLFGQCQPFQKVDSDYNLLGELCSNCFNLREKKKVHLFWKLKFSDLDDDGSCYSRNQ